MRSYKRLSRPGAGLAVRYGWEWVRSLGDRPLRDAGYELRRSLPPYLTVHVDKELTQNTARSLPFLGVAIRPEYLLGERE